MYLDPPQARYRDGEVCIRRAKFLVLMRPDDQPVEGNNIRAVVRSVALHQRGDTHVGGANVGGTWIEITGVYGAVGHLPKVVPRHIWECGEPMRDELYQVWKYAGADAVTIAMRAWARELLEKGGVR